MPNCGNGLRNAETDEEKMPVGFVVNLKDIAREAGVSVSTVSRVMKGKGEIAPETRNRIMNISKQMGYHENRFSKAIRTGKTGLVGVIMDYMDPFFGQIARSIEQVLRQNDFLPITLACNQEEAQGLFHRLVEQRVDGMILIPPYDTADNEFFRELSQCGIPIVTIDREIPADVSFVGTDDYLGGWMNAEYFYRLGHRNLGYYSGPPQASSAALRKKGFLEFCIAHADCRYIPFGTEWWYADTDECIRDFLIRNPETTCIGAFYDSYALQLDRLAKELGRRVPEDLAISGFGNLDYHTSQPPFLTTFDQNPRELGRSAVECLLRHMNDKTLAPEKIRIKPELVIRQSTEKKQAEHSADIKKSTRQAERKA